MNGTCVCRDGEWTGEYCDTPVHEDTLAQVADANNPVGIIVISVAGCAAMLLSMGFAYNHMVKGKRGLNAVPGVEALKKSMKGDDYEAAPENRWASNY
jgi:hypothetical protein